MRNYKNLSKRDSNEESISDVVTKLLKAYGLTKNYEEYETINAFKKLMGALIIKYTEKIHLKNKRLYVKLNSSIIREELSMGKSKIIAMLNEEVGRIVVLDIVFV